MVKQQRDYDDVIRRANSRKDMGVLAICLAIIMTVIVVAVIGGFVAAVAVPEYLVQESVGEYLGSLFGVVFFIVLALIMALVVTRMMRQMYLGNALQIEYSDYAWLRKWSNQVAEDFKMPKVEIMVTQDPYMNAFAFGFMAPYTIVLNSGTIRYLSKDQLRAIVVHEMAHVKYHHTLIGTYLTVFRMLPGVGGVFGWILDFWSRRIELTADRLSLWYLQDVELVKMALIRVYVGPDVAESFNDIARKWQVYMSNNMLNHFTQTFSTHPFLVRRLQHLDDTFEHQLQPLMPQRKEDDAATT